MAKLEQAEIDKAKSDIVSVVGKYVELKKQGKDYFGKCPFHNEKSSSFTVDEKKGFYHCFGCGAHGDAIDFVRAFEGVGLRDAVASITGALPALQQANATRESFKQEQAEEWTPMVPIPAGVSVKPMNIINRKVDGKWHSMTSDTRWEYRTADGQLVGYIYRFNLPTGGKEVVPQTYCVNTESGECQWRWMSFPKPRPMYGLEKLALYPKAQVVLVEGEKTADAAQSLYQAAGIPLEKLIVVSWPGGGKAVKHTDWSHLTGRSVGLWPDADQKTYPDNHPNAGMQMSFIEQPGTVAMLDIFERIKDTAKAVKFFMPPAGVPCGWDLADELPDGFSILEHSKASAVQVPDLIEMYRQPDPIPDPEPEPHYPEYDYHADYSAPAPVTAPVITLTDDDETHDLINNGYFTVLGYDGETYYIFHRQKKQVMAITKGNFSDIGMIELAHPNFWEEHFPKKGGWDNKAAAAWVFNTAHRRGIYDPKKVRGRGAWLDQGRHIFHHGSVLTVDGQPVAIDQIKSAYVYPMGASLPPPTKENPLTDAEGRHLIKVANLVRWSRPASAILMAGWCMLSPICGALKWRPHIWITGAAGTGKSTIQRDFCGSLTRNISHYGQGNSTEPGIRQTLKADALPMLIDELESSTEMDRRRVEAILSMIRQSSSESQAVTMKGTASGDVMNFHIRSMFCIASINTNLDGKADIDRLTALTVRPPAPAGSPDDKWAQLEEELHKLANDETISQRLLARCLSMMPVIHANIAVFIKAAAVKFGAQRQGDQFGTLAAGAWCLTYSRVATLEEATKMLDAYDWNEHTENLDQDDAAKALESVMSAKIKVGLVGDLSVFELVREACPAYRKGVIEQAAADDTLKRHGMRIDIKADQMIFGTSISTLKHLVERCAFVTDLRGQLLRLPGAQRLDLAKRFNGINSKCVAIPLSKLMEGEDRLDEMPI